MRPKVAKIKIHGWLFKTGPKFPEDLPEKMDLNRPIAGFRLEEIITDLIKNANKVDQQLLNQYNNDYTHLQILWGKHNGVARKLENKAPKKSTK
jgi:hypothetical protein